MELSTEMTKETLLEHIHEAHDPPGQTTLPDQPVAIKLAEIILPHNKKLQPFVTHCEKIMAAAVEPTKLDTSQPMNFSRLTF